MIKLAPITPSTNFCTDDNFFFGLNAALGGATAQFGKTEHGVKNIVEYLAYTGSKPHIAYKRGPHGQKNEIIIIITKHNVVLFLFIWLICMTCIQQQCNNWDHIIQL